MKDLSLTPPAPPMPEPPARAALPELRVFTSINDVNLQDELLIQLAKIMQLRDWCIEDLETPTNQKAQVMNTCTNLLAQLAKTQIELYNAERLKKLEMVLIKCLEKLPDHAVAEFMEHYEKAVLELERANP
jgi:hypothetical protein